MHLKMLTVLMSLTFVFGGCKLRRKSAPKALITASTFCPKTEPECTVNLGNFCQTEATVCEVKNRLPLGSPCICKNNVLGFTIGSPDTAKTGTAIDVYSELEKSPFSNICRTRSGVCVAPTLRVDAVCFCDNTEGKIVRWPRIKKGRR